MNLCECGCGNFVAKEKNKFINGHNRKGKNKYYGEDNPNWKGKIKTVKCINCGKEFATRKNNKYYNFCCYECSSIFMRGEKSPFYKGGIYNCSNGYIAVKVGNKYCYEHRIIMEKFLNKKLGENEVVHHIDGDRKNNILKNLKLMEKREHDRKHTTERHKQRREEGSRSL